MVRRPAELSISGSEAVKTEGACLSVSQVSWAAHSTATDTLGVREGGEWGRGEDTKKIRKKKRREGVID